MEAIVLEKKMVLSIRDIEISEKLGPRDVRIAIKNVGICGSDVHFYQHGRIGGFVVNEPMILGHEASGTILETGDQVRELKTGDRVCMEPGIPDPESGPSRMGMYNLDPAIRFWATPPIHGIMRPSVVHPASFTYRLPQNVSLAEGALVEPLAVGMHAATKARIQPGDVAVVIGAGTIGLVTALAALAGGCSCIVLTDLRQPRLDIAKRFGPVRPVNIKKEDPAAVVHEVTEGFGADVVFEASGDAGAAAGIFKYLRPGGRVVYVGMPASGQITIDIVAAQALEARIDTIFRYANVYARALNLLGSGKIDLEPLVTETFAFGDGLKAFAYACNPDPASIKVQIELP